MVDKRGRVKKIIISLVIIAVLVAGYFYLPTILGDSVFPLEYAESIKKWSRDYHEDPFLVAGILMLESGFNPQAQSPVGALGMAQIMPATGRTIASGVGKTDYQTSDLFDPEIAVQFCTWQIHVLKEKYDGNEVAALAAYNAGGGNADKWLRMGLLQDPSTNSYAKKVLDYKTVYHKLYQAQLDLNSLSPVEDEKPVVKIADNNSRNVVWGQTLKNLISLLYGTESQ